MSFLADKEKWKGSDYKDLGPWDFTQQTEKPEYNCGSLIAIKEDPTWTMQTFPGDPIADAHLPCGYWTKEPADRYEPHESTKVIFGGRTLAWSPDDGEQYENGNHLGRFVVADQYPCGTYNDNCDDPSGWCDKPTIAYSDDGGFTWKNCTIPESHLDDLRSGNPVNFTRAYYFPEKDEFFCVMDCHGVFGGILYSTDGIEWKIGMTNKELIIGPQLFINGGLTAWTGDDPDYWAVSGEDASNYITESGAGAGFVSGGSTSLQMTQNQAVLEEKRYRITATLSDYTSGDLTFAVEEAVSGDPIRSTAYFGFSETGSKNYDFDIPADCSLIKVTIGCQNGSEFELGSIELHRVQEWAYVSNVSPVGISLNAGSGLLVAAAQSEVSSGWAGWFYGTSRTNWFRPEGNPKHYKDYSRGIYCHVDDTCYFRGKQFLFINNYDKAYYANRVSRSIGYYEDTDDRDENGWWEYQEDQDGDGEPDYERPYSVTGAGAPRDCEMMSSSFYNPNSDSIVRTMVYRKGYTYDGFNWRENNNGIEMRRLDVNQNWAFGSVVWAALGGGDVMYCSDGRSWQYLGDGSSTGQTDIVAGRDRIIWTTNYGAFGDHADSSPKIQIFKFKTITVTPGDPG